MNTHFLYFDLSSGGVTGKNPIYIYIELAGPKFKQ